jgi:hypothetical protein
MIPQRAISVFAFGVMPVLARSRFPLLAMSASSPLTKKDRTE